MLDIVNYSAGYSKYQFLFDEISMQVFPSQVVGVKGLNGCGKSTFIKGIINLIPFRKGEIYLNGCNITKWETSKIFGTNQIGYLSQRNRVFNELTVAEHLKLYLKYSKDNQIPCSYNFKKLFSIIDSKYNFPASFLSGGEQLILSLLCLEIANPPLLLLDEPSDSLDSNSKDLLLHIIESWKENNKGIVLIEQDLMLLNNVSDIVFSIN